MRTAGMKALVALVAALAIAGCGQVKAAAPDPVSYQAHGLTVELPEGWQHADSPLTRLTDPREVLSVGTYPLRYRPVGCSHMPSSALLDLGPGDALVTLLERGREPGSAWTDFPARPDHFGPRPNDGSEAPECVPAARFTDHWFGFTDGGRHFHVLVAFGPEVTAATREQAWSILDGLKIDPEPKPDWESAG
jgi:hypothetical protein